MGLKMVHLTYITLNEIGMIFVKDFLKMVLVLIPQHNVHQMHVIQVLLMINLMVFEEKIEEYNLLIIVVLELFEIVPLQHKIQHNLMKYEIIIYYVHVTMHVRQLNSVLFKRIIKYELKLLKVNKIVQSLHMIQQNFELILKRKKKKKKTMAATTATETATEGYNVKNGISINTYVITCIKGTLYKYY